jgi:hypothetical protein
MKYKLLKENLHDLRLGKDFLDITQKAHAAKEKLDLIGLNQISSKLRTFVL